MGRNEKAAMQAGADAMAHAFAGERSELLSVVRVLYHALVRLAGFYLLAALIYGVFIAVVLVRRRFFGGWL